MRDASRAGADAAWLGMAGSPAAPGAAQAVTLRRLGWDDAPLVQRFVAALSPRSRHRRFFSAVRELSPGQLRAMTGSGDPRDLALGAFIVHDGASLVGLAQCAVADNAVAEVAFAVADAWQRRGLGERLMGAIVAHARSAGIRALHGTTLAENWAMLSLAVRHGFEIVEHEDPQLACVSLRFA